MPNDSGRRHPVRCGGEHGRLCQQDGQEERTRRHQERDNHGDEHELFSSWLSPGGMRERNACRKLRLVWEPRFLSLLFATVLFGCRRPLVLLICERGIILHGTFPSSKELRPFACTLKYPWRSLLFALHGRGSSEGLFSIHRLNGFTCTWSVLSLPGAKQRTGPLSRSDSRKKMRGR